MASTALIYSSHDRCEYIHNQWIVQRALAGNKKVLFLPFSQGTDDADPFGRQKWSWDNFAWYFRRFEQDGLNAFPFYWSNDMPKEDIDQLMSDLWEAEVVILGGGNPTIGLRRFKDVGEQYYDERGCFERILHERQDRGLLTVGFSAGTDQLCQFMTSGIGGDIPDGNGFGMLRNVMATSHYEPGREETMIQGARQFGQCMMFGLPNDSGIGCDQGWTPGGNIWQHLEFVTDMSWDIPQHGFHIKTRQGCDIPHYYPDGRYWGFKGGDQMLRIQSPDNRFQRAWILPANSGQAYDWWTQNPVGFVGFEEEIGFH